MRAAPVLLLLALCTVCSAQTFVEGPVPGKYSLEPARLFSEAIVAGNYAFLSGVPSSEELSIEDGVADVLTSLNATLASLGGSLDNAVKCTVFLNNISEFSGLNAVYPTFFTTNLPARTTVQATNPGGGALEIDVIAWLPEGAAAASA